MQSNKLYGLKWLWAVMFMCICIFSAAQENKTNMVHNKQKGPYSLVVDAGGGISFYTAAIGTPAGFHTSINRIHPIGSLRIMWHPDHLLQIGVETGLTDFYTYKVQDGRSGNLIENAVPLLLIFSVPVTRRIHVYAGSGVYLITSKLNYNGKVNSSDYSLGWMVSGSYEYPLTNTLGIAGGMEWLNAFVTQDASLTIQIHLRWKFYSW
jgi:hypothetical protein